MDRPTDFRGVYRDDDAARAVYSEAAGIARIWPRAIAVPTDVEDLRALVRWAFQTTTPLIPRGSGSSMPGGAIGDGVIVDMSRWRQIGPVDRVARTVRVEPGAIRDDVDRAARIEGLRLPVDPSSGAFCTMGGMTATNAAGAHSMHFGSIRRWVRAVDCVFADGSRAEVRRGSRPPSDNACVRRFITAPSAFAADRAATSSASPRVLKNSSGYATNAFAGSGELADLLVGSEGTLAFFVNIELDLIPVARATSSVLGAFASIEEAVTAAVRVRNAGAVACELLDRTFLDVAASAGRARPLPASTESALLAEIEGTDAHDVAAAARQVEAIFREHGAIRVRIALESHVEAELWELRHAASPILARLDPHLRSMQFIEDGVVPPDRLAAYVHGIRDILNAHEIRGVIFGHAGDANVHVNPLIDVSRPLWRVAVQNVLNDVANLTASLGGSLSGEHGDGRLRTPLLAMTWTAEALDEFAAVKRAFDPSGILNPGVKVPLPGQSALGDIKYDPNLGAFPPAARAALDRVERQRAYAGFRLDLIDDDAES